MLVGVLGTGVPRLAFLRPMAWLKGQPSMTHLHQHELKILARDQASWGGRQEAPPGTASSRWLARRRRDQGRVPHEVPMTQAVTTKARQAPGGRRPAQSPCFLFGAKGGKRRQEYQAKATILVQQDQDQQNGRMEVIVGPSWHHRQSLWQARTDFSLDKCTRCSPSKWPIVGALPAQYLGRGPGPRPINRASHQSRRGSSHLEPTDPDSILPKRHHLHKNSSPREAVLPLYCSSSAPEAIHHTTN